MWFGCPNNAHTPNWIKYPTHLSVLHGIEEDLFLHAVAGVDDDVRLLQREAGHAGGNLLIVALQA